MAMAVLPMLSVGGMQLFRTESYDSADKVVPRAAQLAGGIGIVYASLTARRQTGIDDAYAACQLCGAGHDLVGAVIGFGAEKLHAADRKHRQDGHRHDDDADTAKPLQQCPPDENAG